MAETQTTNRAAKRRPKSAKIFASGTKEELQIISDLLGGRHILGSAVKSELDAHALLN